MPKSQVSQSPDWRENRRLQALELHQKGWSQREIATELGVTQGAVSQWLKRAREGGAAALRHVPAPGRRAALTNEQLAQLPSLIADGASMYGFRGDGWTTKRVANVLQHVFGVSHHPAHVSRLLRKHCPNWRDDKKTDEKIDPNEENDDENRE
jgi:transposase